MVEIEIIKGSDNGNPPDTLSQMYPKVNRNFTNINGIVAANKIDADNNLKIHENSASAHDAQNIAYSGNIIGASNVKQALDNTEQLIDDLILGSGDSGPEVVAARGGHVTLGDRLNSSDAQLSETAKRGNRYIARILYKMFMGESVTVVCYGDSITYGYQVGSGDQVANPYPAVLQARLRQVYKNDNITVINAGHSGWRTDQALANINDVISLNPDLVLVMFGMNDNNSQNVPLEPYRDNLTAITNAIRWAGSDLILLTPTPARRADLESNKRLRLYADMVREVAANNGVCCVDLQNEITRLWHTTGLYPVDTLGDGVHFVDDQYKLIADVVMYKVMQFNSSTSVVYVDSREEFSVPLVYSPFVDTNMTTTFTLKDQIYKQNYTATSATTVYLRLNFFCGAPGMSLILRHARNSGGGVLVISDNGDDVAEVSFYSPSAHQFNAENVLIENLKIGWHSILFDGSRVSQGLGGGLNFYLGEILFRPFFKNLDRPFRNIATHTLPNRFENFKSVTNRVRVSGDVANQTKGAALFSAGSVELQPSKKLVIEAEGKWTSGSGITWFGDELQTANDTVASGYQSGYLLYFSGGVTLYYTGASSNTVFALQAAPFEIDYNLPHSLRIEHSPAGEIVVYVDGVQRISYTDTKLRSGYFGLWINGMASMDLERYEFCYIDV